MSLLDRLKRVFNKESEAALEKLSAEVSNVYKDILNTTADNGSSINIQDVSIGNTTIYNYNKTTIKIFKGSEDTPEIIENTSINENFEHIRLLQDEGKTRDALNGYIKLETKYFGEPISENDKFSILNGIYNCRMNLDDDSDILYSLENKIEQLNQTEIKAFYKFRYLQAIRSFKSGNTDKAFDFCEKALNLKSDYVRAIVLKAITQHMNKEITYDEAIFRLDSIIQNLVDDNKKDKVFVLIGKGDIANKSKHYDDALLFYTETQLFDNSLNVRHAIAMCHYNKAMIAADENGRISFDDVDYDELHIAGQLCEDLYREALDLKNEEFLKDLIPSYFSILQFLDKQQAILDIKQKSSYLLDSSDENIASISAYAEFIYDTISEDTFKTLSEIEKKKYELRGLIKKSNYIKALQKIRTDSDRDLLLQDKSMIYLYLISLIHEKDDNFILEFKEYFEKDEKDPVLTFIWARHLEVIGEISEAEEYLEKYIDEKNSPFLTHEAFEFYFRNKKGDKAFTILSKIVNRDYKSTPTYDKEYLKTYFFMLIDREMYEDAESFFGSIDFTNFDQKEKLEVEIEYCRIIGDFKGLAAKSQSYFEVSDNIKAAIQSANYLALSNQIDKAIAFFEDVQNTKKHEESMLYIVLSNLYIIAGNNEAAYNAAFKARDIDKNNHKSESHKNFVTICTRINRTDDSVKYMFEFNQTFPKEDWIQVVEIRNDEDDILKALKPYLSDNTAYNVIRNYLFNYNIGFSTYLESLKNYDIATVLHELRYYKKSLKISDGLIENINSYFGIIQNEIIVDALTLFVLNDADVLDILNDFDKVYITYATIEFFQNMLFRQENSEVRKILDFINRSIGIRLVSVKLLDIKENNAFLRETMYCLGYSNSSGVPYLAVDFGLRVFMPDESKSVVNLPTVLRALTLKDLKKQRYYSSVGYKLLKKGYTFINFNALDLFNHFIALENYDDLKNEFDVYFSMSRFSDYASFINVYLGFLSMIENVLSKENYLKFVLLIFTYVDWYVGRTRSYLVDILKMLEGSIYDFFFRTTNYVSDAFLFVDYVDGSVDDPILKNISSTLDYIKFKQIVTTMAMAVFNFLYKYKDNKEQLNEYVDFFRTRFKFIDIHFIDLSVKKMLDFEFPETAS